MYDKNSSKSSFSSSHDANVHAEALAAVGKGCSDPQVGFSRAPCRKASAGQTSPFCFLGGLSVHPGQHAANHREAAARWGRHSHHVSMCPHGDMEHQGVRRRHRTPSPLLTPPPSLNEPDPERSFLDPKKSFSEVLLFGPFK